MRLNPNAQFGPEGRTLLHAAAIRGEVKLVSAIGHCKFDVSNVVDFVDFLGNSALHHAVIKNKPQVKSRWFIATFDTRQRPVFKTISQNFSST